MTLATVDGFVQNFYLYLELNRLKKCKILRKYFHWLLKYSSSCTGYLFFTHPVYIYKYIQGAEKT